MSESAFVPVQVPPPPRDIPRWFFIRRMQALAFSGAIMLLVGLVNLVGVIIWSGHLPPGPDWHLDRRRHETQGQLEGTRFMPHYHMGNRSPWEVRFTFKTPGGRPIHATGYTFDESYQLKQPGDVIPIEYDPDDPTIARPAGGWHSLFPWWIYALVGAPMILPGLGVMLILWVRVRQERSLLTHGQAVEGRVVAVKTSWYVHFGSKHPYDIDYVFGDLIGQEQTGRDRTYRYAWAASLRPGDPLIVIHDTMDLRRNALWIDQPGR